MEVVNKGGSSPVSWIVSLLYFFRRGEVIQRRNWILLQMGDSARFVVFANLNLRVSFENWHYRSSPVRVSECLNRVRLHQPVQFFLYLPLLFVNGTYLTLKNMGGWSLTTQILAVFPFSLPNPSASST